MSDFFKVTKSGQYSFNLDPLSADFNYWSAGRYFEDFAGMRNDGSATTPTTAQGNNFSEDTDVLLLLNFEAGTVHLDSSGLGNNFTITGTSATDSTKEIQGDSCAFFNNAWDMSRTDADLTAGFPTKSGDTTKRFSVCCWFQPQTAVELAPVIGKWNTTGNKRSWKIAPGSTTYTCKFYWGRSSGTASDTIDTGVYLTNGYWYHLSFIVDGVAKTCKIRIWDDYNQVYVVDQTYTPSSNEELYVSDAALIVGADPSSANRLRSYVDELVLFDRLLTNSETIEIRLGQYGAPEPPVPVAPSAAQNLTVTDTTLSTISLAWDDVSADEAGFYVERRTTYSGWSLIDTLAANTETYIDEGLPYATLFYYRVGAYNAFGTSYSNETSGSTLYPSAGIYLDRSCEAWWRFERAAIGSDSTPNHNDLSFYGTPVCADGIVSGGIGLSGTSYLYRDNADLSDYFPGSLASQLGQGTVSFWVRIESEVQYAKVFSLWDSSGGARIFGIQPGGPNYKFSVVYGNTGGVASSTVEFDYNLSLGKWYHITVIWGLSPTGTTTYSPRNLVKTIIWDNDSSSVVLNATEEGPTLYDINDNPRFIIGSEVGGSNKFNGILDEMYVFARQLREDEVTSLRELTFDFVVPYHDFSGTLLKARWKFAFGAEGTDSVGTNNLTLVGTPTYEALYHPLIEPQSCIDLENPNDYLTIADASLSTGFPFKSGDAGKKISIGIWYLGTANTATGTKNLISKYDSSSKRSFALYFNNGALYFTYGKTDGSAGETIYLAPVYRGYLYSSTGWSFIGLSLDGLNKRLNLFHYDYLTGGFSEWDIPLAHEVGVFDAPLQIGASEGTNTWDGKIADVMIFDDFIGKIDYWYISQGQYPPPLSGVTVYSETLYTELTRYDEVHIQESRTQTEVLLGHNPSDPNLINITENRVQAEIKKFTDITAVFTLLERQQVEFVERGVVTSGVSVNELLCQIEVIYEPWHEPEISHEYPGMIIQKGRGYGRYYKMDIQNGNIVLTYKE